MSQLLIIILGVFAGVLSLFYLLKRYYFQGGNHKNRVSISLESSFREVFTESEVPFSELVDIWVKIASLLEIDPEKLRASDRFDQEFKPVSNDGRDDRLIRLNKFILSHGVTQAPDDVGKLVKLLLSNATTN